MSGTEQKSLTGHCLCGAVRYRVPWPFVGGIGYCHCTMCRRAAGAVAVAWFDVKLTDFEILGDKLKVYKSSDHAERGNCGVCGTPVTFWTSRLPDTIDITLASLDRPEDIAANHHSFTDTRLPWLRLDTHLPDRSTNTGED